MTTLEYYNTPETLLPQELIYGQLRVADAPFVSHQRIVLKLAMALHAHVEAHGAGEVLVSPVDVVLDADRGLVLQPDLLFVANDRHGVVIDRVYGPPDLVVEILSPHPRIGKVDEKIHWYAEYGVREIWLYHQVERRLDVLRCADGAIVARAAFERNTVKSAVLPEFAVSIDSIVNAW